eukprot:8651322-Pyramimonas_sp.AAC.1
MRVSLRIVQDGHFSEGLRNGITFALLLGTPAAAPPRGAPGMTPYSAIWYLSLIHISEPTRPEPI